MAAPYLTTNGRSYVLQIRPQAALAPDLKLAPLRLTLGVINASEAAKKARKLAAAATDAFDEVSRKMQAGEITVGSGRDFLKLVREMTLPLAGMHLVGQNTAPEYVAVPAARGALQALAALGRDAEANSSELARLEKGRLAKHYFRVIADEDAARAYLELPSKPKDDTATQLARLAEQVELFENPARLVYARSLNPTIRGAAGRCPAH